METLETVEPWRNRELIEQRSGLHYITLPFHHGQHRLDVRDDAIREANLYLEAGGDPDEIDFDAIESAGPYHDAGVYLPLSWHGFRSKEAYSIEVHTVEQLELGMPEKKVELGNGLIAVTERGTHCTTIMQRIFRRADLKNVASKNPLVVVKNAMNLNDEVGILSIFADLLVDPEFQHLSDQEKLNVIYENPDIYDYRKRRPDMIQFGRGSHELLQDLVTEDLSVPGCPDFNASCFANLPWLGVPNKLKQAVKEISDRAA